MVFWALFLVSCIFCVQTLLNFHSVIFKTVRIERQMIKHTFLFCFLHCVNIICTSITKRDPNNLSWSVFSPQACASMANIFLCEKCHIITALPLYRLYWYWVFLYINSQCLQLQSFYKQLFSSSRRFIRELKKTYCYRK